MNFRRVFLILAAALVLIAAGAISAKLHSHSQSALMCDNLPCARLASRLAAIEKAIRERGGDGSYLMIGDSITERADLPEICGRKPINAGIGGATTRTFQTEAHRLADLAKPSFIIVALGTNDAIFGGKEGFRERLDALIASLRPSKIIVLPAPPNQATQDTKNINDDIASLKVFRAAQLDHADTIDGVHLAASSYIEWKQNLIAAASRFVCS
jgi:hypothetical protein